MIRPVTSASNVHRRALCPGSERLEAGLPEEDSPQSQEGTLLHSYDASPQLDRTVLKPQQRDLLRISKELDDFVFARVAEQFGIAANDVFQYGNEKELLALEETPQETPGHCDRWGCLPKKRLLVIIDKKFGYRETTPAAANYQLRTYAIAGAEQWDVDHVVVAITQPRLSYEQRVTMAVYSMEDIAAAEDELIAIRKASAKPDAPLVAGEEQCRYCKAKLICPAYKAQVTEGLALVQSGDGTVTKREATAERSLAECNDAQLDAVLIAIQFSDFIKDLARDEARRRIANGALTNWKLGKETEVREIVDPKRALSLLTLKGDLTRDEVFDCSNPSITKIEEKLREKTGGTWKEAREILETTLAPVIEREPKKPSLTRIK
jgi:hypothetical protein